MKRLLVLLAMAACVGAGCDAQVPSPTPKPRPVGGNGVEGATCRGPNDSTSCASGYECTQECGPPVVRDGDAPPGYSCHRAGEPRMCPICLASNTTIATPSGEVNVRSLRVGQFVWTQNLQGKKIAAPITKVVRTPVPKTHQVIHLVLKDGREAWISPNHPTADGNRIGQLKAGVAFAGSVVKSSDSVPYWDDATYDLLPSGETGIYWANGMLVGSTLR